MKDTSPEELLNMPFDEYLKHIGGTLKRLKKREVKKETKFKKLLNKMGENDGAEQE